MYDLYWRQVYEGGGGYNAVNILFLQDSTNELKAVKKFKYIFIPVFEDLADFLSSISVMTSLTSITASLEVVAGKGVVLGDSDARVVLVESTASVAVVESTDSEDAVESTDSEESVGSTATIVLVDSTEGEVKTGIMLEASESNFFSRFILFFLLLFSFDLNYQ